MDKLINSPIKDNAKAKLIQTINSNKVAEGYKTIFNIDVSNFFLGVDEIGIYECETTGYQFYYPDTLSGDGFFYTQLQNIEWYYQAWKWEFEMALGLIEKNSKVLEIGCGEGAFLKRVKVKASYCVGLEINNNTITNKDGFSIINKTIEAYALQNKNEFDWVISFQVLEHISNVRRFIEASLECLKPGGKLLIAVPNNDAFFFKKRLIDFNDNEYQKTLLLNLPPHHMSIWNKRSLSSLQNIFSIKLDNFFLEPLRPWRKDLNLRIKEKTKGPVFKKIMKFIPPKYFYRLLGLFNKDVNMGDTIIVVFQKV